MLKKKKQEKCIKKNTINVIITLFFRSQYLLKKYKKITHINLDTDT